MNRLNVTPIQIKGFTLVEMLLSIAVLSIMTTAVVSFSYYVSAFDQAERQHATIYGFKEELVTSLGNGKFWQNIVDKAGSAHPTAGTSLNPEMVCLRDQTPCAEGDYDLTVLDLDGKIRFDAIDRTAGFNRKGTLCKGFSETANPQSLNCPYRFEIRWSPICEAGSTTCANPMVRITASLKTVSDISINANANAADLNVNFIISSDPVSDPIVNSLSLFTNSDVLNFGTSVLDIDLATAVTYAGSISSLVFSSPTSLSLYGGSVQVVGTTMRYTPPAKFYGRDSIAYTITAPSGKIFNGLINVGVMTPHTWLGPTSGGPGSTSNLSNFCGQVQNGACDRTNFPASSLDVHYVFNELCESCDVILNSAPHSIEMSPSYSAKVQLAQNIIIIGNSSNSWAKFPIYGQHGGTFEPRAAGLSLTVSSKIISGARALGQRTFVVDGGTFISPSVHSIVGSAVIGSGNYIHNNAMLEIYGIAGTSDSNYLSANGVQFYNLSFGTGAVPNQGDHNGMSLVDSFVVLNDLHYYPEAEQDTLCAWESGGPVTGTASSLVTMTVEGNLVTGKAGGRGSANGCKSPTIVFSKPGSHTISGPPVVDTLTSAFTASYAATWTTVQNQIQNQIPHLPYIKVDHALASLTMTGFIGLRRGLENRSDSSINMTGANLVLAHSDLGDSFFKPEAVAGVIKNPMKSLFLAGTGGGRILIGSRDLQINGNLYTALDQNTMLASDAAPNAVIHLKGDYVQGPGEAFKDQSAVAFAVHTKFDGSSDQTIQGDPWASTLSGNYAPFDVTIDKSGGTLYGRGTLNLLRDFTFINGATDFGSVNAVTGFLGGFGLHLMDQGIVNGYVQTLNFIKPNVRIAKLVVAHHMRVLNSFQADSFQLGQSIVTYGQRTIEFGPAATLTTMEFEMNNTDSAPTPDFFRVIGPNYMHLKVINERSVYTNINASTIAGTWGKPYRLNQVQFDLEGKFSDGVRRRIEFASSGMEFPGSIVNVAPNTLVCQWPYNSLTVGAINIGAGSGWMKQFGPLVSGTVTGAPIADRKAGYQCWNEYIYENFGIWGPPPP